ncbi:MAG: thiamine phosphate synthase [Deltaproteobacteria bacterium]|nr:MAG: thiamine phosphate synthase [Deltaproteobacteria bacterium]
MNHPNRKSPDIKSVVLIGGSDSSAGAGIQVDARFLSSLGVPFKNIITAITAQEHGAFHHCQDTSDESLKAQAKVLKDDSIVKIGMMGKSLRVLNELLDKQVIILDPVLFTSSGSALLDEGDLNFLKKSFLPKVKIITPNIVEAEILWGNKINSPQDVEKAAEYIKTLGPENILIKGGHLKLAGMGDFFLGEKRFWIKSEKIDSERVRGTGCALASSLAGGLALGLDIYDALVMAKILLHKSYRSARQEGDYFYLNPTSFHQGLKPEDMPWTQKHFADQKAFPEFKLKNKTTLYPIVDRAHWIKELGKASPLMIQLRIKDLEGDCLEREIIEAIELSKEFGVSLFINDFWQLAIKHGAFGVHLGQEDLADVDLNAIRDNGIRLGVSTHCYFEATWALGIRPSYIAFGPIYHTALKAMDFAPQGLENLRLWRNLFDLPLVAIGGINLERGSAVAQTGVDIISVVRDILLDPAPIDRTKNWKSQIGEQIH